MPTIVSDAPAYTRFTRKQTAITMAGLLLAMFLSSLDQTIVGTAMPRIIADLGGFTHYTWVATAYMVTSTVMTPIAGKLSDMYGRKYLYLAGISLFLIGSTLCGFSQDMTQIILSRGLQGIGAGINFASAFSVVGDLFPPQRRARWAGVFSAVFGVSSIVGPSVGGYLTDSITWHWVFFINIPLGLIVLALFTFYFPNFRPAGVKQQPDYLGVSTLILAVVPLLLALSWGGTDYPWGSPLIIGLLTLSAAAVAGFAYVEKRAVEPLIPPAIFRAPSVGLSFVLNFFIGMGMFGGIIFVPLYFQGVLGVSATSSGNLMMPMMLSSIVSTVLAGQLMSRTGGHFRIIGGSGLAIMATGIFLLSRMTPETTYLNAVINIVITGLGMGATMPVFMIYIQNVVDFKYMGISSSLIGFMRSMGGVLGLAVFGTVMNARFGDSFLSRIPPAVRGAIPPDFLNTVSHNAQALVSPGAQEQLKTLFDRFGAQGQDYYSQLLKIMRDSLDSSITLVFVIGFGIMLLAFVLSLFLKEQTFRKMPAMAAANPPVTMENTADEKSVAPVAENSLRDEGPAAAGEASDTPTPPPPNIEPAPVYQPAKPIQKRLWDE
jgi:EmrB/QacA subfamily drug resistance transporter